MEFSQRWEDHVRSYRGTLCWWSLTGERHSLGERVHVQDVWVSLEEQLIDSDNAPHRLFWRWPCYLRWSSKINLRTNGITLRCRSDTACGRPSEEDTSNFLLLNKCWSMDNIQEQDIWMRTRKCLAAVFTRVLTHKNGIGSSSKKGSDVFGEIDSVPVTIAKWCYVIVFFWKENVPYENLETN